MVFEMSLNTKVHDVGISLRTVTGMLPYHNVFENEGGQKLVEVEIRKPLGYLIVGNYGKDFR